MNKKEVETRVEYLVEKLRQRDCRITPQRLALLKLLVSSEEHPSAAQLHEQLKQNFPTTSLATVYKTLNVLKEMGEVIEMGFSNGDNRYDGAHPYAHAHLVCVQCQRIEDASLSITPKTLQEVARQAGYKFIGHRLDLYGLCQTCREQQERY